MKQVLMARFRNFHYKFCTTPLMKAAYGRNIRRNNKPVPAPEVACAVLDSLFDDLMVYTYVPAAAQFAHTVYQRAPQSAAQFAHAVYQRAPQGAHNTQLSPACTALIDRSLKCRSCFL
jgi:hypothetical protein